LIVPLLIVGVWPWGERIAFDFVLLSKASRLSCGSVNNGGNRADRQTKYGLGASSRGAVRSAPMLTIDGVTLRLGGHLILDRACAALPPKSRVGLVGRNGAGKSSLLKLIAGIYEPDSGAIETPSGMRIGYVAQEAPGGSGTPFETVLAAATERSALLAEAEHAKDPHRIGEIHDRLTAIDAHGASARAARILAGLGFDEEAQHRPLDTFSGGWRMRVALAALLFSEPDLLLLDEPSNHLDLEAALWLESFLKSYRASLIVVSHERDLLNSVADHILHLNRGTLSLYPGNYESFARLRREREAQTEAMRAQQEAKAKKLQAYVDRWRYKAHTARQAQSRLKALAKLQPIAAVTGDASVVFDFPSPMELRPPLIVLEDVEAGYVADSPVLSRLNLRIDPDDRIALVGRNGNGKTTLARLLAGQLKPMGGALLASGKLRVGYFAQHQIEELVADETPLQHMERLLPEAKPGEARTQLGHFGFSGDKVNLAVCQLSGGERARLSLALITLGRAAYSDPGRAHQPSRRGGARGAGRGFGRLRRRRDRGQPRPPSARADRRPARSGGRRNGEGLRRQPRGLSRIGAQVRQCRSGWRR
jgi:ATP-binding cassette, subfamily F, member 3